MRLGVDFGTTRMVTAVVDRGNYPVVTYEAPDGSTCDWFPPLVAVRGGSRLYGWEAWTAQEDPSATVIRSLKRVLEDAGPETRVEIAGQVIGMLDLLGELMAAFKAALLERSNLTPKASEPLEIMLGVPANANSNQRFLTVEAFRRAGFEVLGLLNEPSAASIEFGHRNRAVRQAREMGRLLVYDLGGGTFDASLVEMDERTHSVIASEGIGTLGGDDFDNVLAELALEKACIPAAERDNLTQAEFFRLHEECRVKKEALHPNTRKIAIDLDAVRPGWGSVTLPVADFYEVCRGMVEETLHAVEDLLASHGYPEAPIEALYVTGGGSELPLVSRLLRERFGRRVRRSAYTRLATAIGLAIQADAQAGYVLRERFMRHFGVWREADQGRTIVFDPLFEKGLTLPGPGEPPRASSRRYCPVHNIGHFRYLECSSRAENGRPTGDITFWDEIRFPFDPCLRDAEKLDEIPVEHSPRAALQQIEETYACDSSGTVCVTIANRSAGYVRTWKLGRWAAKDTRIVPGRRRRGPAKS